MLRIRNRLAALVVAILVFILAMFPSHVLAIGNPTNITMPSVATFRDVLTTGDQLWFVRYNIDYASTPSEPASSTYLMAIYGTDGTTLLYTRAVNYYEENIISIYLSPAQALTWQDSYRVKIMGNPGVFSPLIEDTNMQTWVMTPGDYYEQEFLQGYLLGQADILQTDWGITILTAGNKLNVTGATFFTEAIPGLNSMLPNFFQVTTSSMTGENTSYSSTYARDTEARRGSMNAAFREIGRMFGISEGWSMVWSVGILVVIVMGVVYAAAGKKSEIAAVAGFAMVALCGWIGLIDLEIVVILVMVVAVMFSILFWLGRLA